MIQITDVTKRYGRRVVLDGVSLTLQPGEITLLQRPTLEQRDQLVERVQFYVRPALWTLTRSRGW